MKTDEEITKELDRIGRLTQHDPNDLQVLQVQILLQILLALKGKK